LKTFDKKTALIVIDAQIGFDDPSWGPRNNLNAEARMAHLIETWRDADAPVIHVHHHSAGPEGKFQPETHGIKPKLQALPRKDEAVYYKRVNSAFIGTTLERDLRRQSINTLVVIGFTTNHCVSTTVRMAGNLGFTTYVIADATATFDRAGADGRLRTADAVHDAALGDLQGEFAEVIDTHTAIAALADRG